MKVIACGIVAAVFAATPALAQSSYTTTQGGNICLRSLAVDHTRAPDDRSIIFYMKDNKAWITHLKSVCPQLSFNGFSYVATPPDDICGGLEAIRVIRTGAICMMGPFEPYTPPPKTGSGM
ncbi:MAG: hypothetical protein ABSD74_03035 [Rhizomicrobium sp.]|jgi:hypothetical protein